MRKSAHYEKARLLSLCSCYLWAYVNSLQKSDFTRCPIARREGLTFVRMLELPCFSVLPILNLLWAGRHGFLHAARYTQHGMGAGLSTWRGEVNINAKNGTLCAAGVTCCFRQV